MYLKNFLSNLIHFAAKGLIMQKLRFVPMFVVLKHTFFSVCPVLRVFAIVFKKIRVFIQIQTICKNKRFFIHLGML